MFKKQFQALCLLVFSGLMQTDYVWDVWDFTFMLAGAVFLGLFLFGETER